MNTCSSCQELKTVIRIRSPYDLTQILRLVQSKLSGGDFAEDVIQQESAVNYSQNPFSTLTADGPWPDVLQYYFHCTARGQTFSLEVETYHGVGGTWGPLN